MSCWWNHLFHLFRGKPNATSIRITIGDRGWTTSRLHLPAAWRRRRPNDPRRAGHLRARWLGMGVEPSQVGLGEDVIGYNRKTSLATPREANFGFFQSLLVVFAGIGNSKLVTLRPNMAKHRTINQSRVKNLCSHKPHLSPLVSLSKLIIKQIGGVLEVSSSMQTFPWWPLLMVTSSAIIFQAESFQARKSNILAIDI